MRHSKRLKKILFVCVGNTCRSQMAEGFANRYGNGKIEAMSAGTSAAGIVNGYTIDAMKEIGIDISGHTSVQLTREMIEWADIVVTLGCSSAETLCPSSYDGKKYDWKVEDPLGRPWEFMQRVRDSIGRKVRELIDDEG
ncbi:MAG: arsenate reductase ArsC [Deltaproteobacteria bacterium]|nr:arsenate reductase ArsC [Deltaproteobacteria bacterium]